MKVRKVLLVDNSKTMLKILENVLSGDIAETILESESEEDALKILQEQQDIEIVITEHHPPEIDGLSLTANIRKLESQKHTHIIIATKEVHKSVVVAAMEAGCDDYLVRPFNAGVLISKIDYFLKKQRKQAIENETKQDS